jgi:hypothetical protein
MGTESIKDIFDLSQSKELPRKMIMSPGIKYNKTRQLPNQRKFIPIAQTIF